jgi:transcription antitermination factor NusA-like protein
MKFNKLISFFNKEQLDQVIFIIEKVIKNICKLHTFNIFRQENEFFIKGPIKNIISNYEKEILIFDENNKKYIKINSEDLNNESIININILEKYNIIFSSLLYKNLLQLNNKKLIIEKTNLLHNYIGEIVYGLIVRSTRELILVKFFLNQVETFGILEEKNMVKNEVYEIEKQMYFFVLGLEKNKNNDSTFLILDRKSDFFLQKLLELKIDTLNNGLITIQQVKRIPGIKAKVLVSGKNNPVKEVVGISGIKILSLRNEIMENIDIIEYFEDPIMQLKALMKPIEPISINIQEDLITINIEIKYMKNFIGSKQYNNLGINCRLLAIVLGKKITFVPVDENINKNI